ncbi:hypothetical protein BGX28_008834 [Mortierella sp. GBA30]|nr:hypothetical protein BGX28_008834 [Mortierella sp. GBA30]
MSPNTHRRCASMTTQTGIELVSSMCTAAQPLCATSESEITTNVSSSSTLASSDIYPDVTSKTTTPSSPIRKQSVMFLKNGLPIKSAMKSMNVARDPSSRHSTIRSHTSPGSLNSPKYVHFNTQLEHVRLFLQGETPSCIAERATILDVRQDSLSRSGIKLVLTNWSPVPAGAFMPGNFDAGVEPLRVEKVELSEDQTELQGKVLIQNIAFHKHVSVRFTVDYWQTQSEVNAEFEESIPGSALDRFAFKIPLEMEKSMVEKTFCFAVRYQVIGREFWDSNNGMNYQVECKRVVVVAPAPSAASDLSKQMNSILLASRLPDYSKPVLKKKSNNPYDLSSSLSAAYSQPVGVPTRGSSISVKPDDDLPVSKTAYRPSEYIMPVQSPPGYHHSLYASSPKFVNPYISAASPPEHFHIEFDQLSIDAVASKRGARNSWAGRERESGSGFYGSYASSPVTSSPISIPSSRGSTEHRPAVGSSGYYDLVDRYCFYESSPHSHPSSPYSSYPNSPPAPCIRG